jgi:hypothetical protein
MIWEFTHREVRATALEGPVRVCAMVPVCQEVRLSPKQMIPHLTVFLSIEQPIVSGAVLFPARPGSCLAPDVSNRTVSHFLQVVSRRF